MTVDDGGIVALYFMKDFKRPPLIFEYVGFACITDTPKCHVYNALTATVSQRGEPQCIKAQKDSP